MTDNLLATEDPTPIDDTKDYLNELVGEDKKFKTVEDLAKGKHMSDSYITVLERRLDELSDEYKKVREENIAGPKLQELIDRMDQLQNNRQETPQKSNEAAYDPKAVESLVSSQILKHEQTKKEQENYEAVRTKLVERFGNDYKTALKKQSDALGLSDEEVNSMARKNPALFTKTFDLNVAKTENFQTPPRSERRSDSFAPTSAEKRTWSYYVKLREKDPMAWLDKKIAIQMEHDSQKYGKDFYDM